MKLVLLSIETSKQGWFESVSDLYSGKISHYLPFEFKRLKSKDRSRDAQDRKIEEEGRLILDNLETSDFVILCDEKGTACDSKAFAKKMISAVESGKKRLVFVIGGAYGVADEIKARANWTWSLAPMTLNHFIAQTVAMEQIFRALTIWRGVPYHNE
ncbi:MAG: 23S rRNA (pseudouridine(1915)-N(3))-methyltransferase RlmH [Bdellovibrionia bacterium]